jgi:RNA recognition motif-containing protein
MTDSQGDIQRTIFIRNINYQTTGETLSKSLSKFGPLASCRIISTFNGRERISRGFGFAEFKTVEGFNAAVNNKTEVSVDDRVLTIRASEPRERRKRDTAFIRGIPEKTTADQIRGIFAKYNPIEVRIVYFDNAERGKGFAFVKFATEEDQTAAVTQNKTVQLNGQETIVRFARPQNARRFGFRRGPKPQGPKPQGRAPRAPRVPRTPAPASPAATAAPAQGQGQGQGQTPAKAPAAGGEQSAKAQRPRRVRKGPEGQKAAPSGN